MRIAIIGQHDFGKAVFEAFRARGDIVCGVFCAPEPDGAKPDALRVASEAANVPTHQFRSLRGADAHDALRRQDADLAVMAYVLQFAPPTLLEIPRLGAIQYHPSLLPKHRGPSAISWAIATGQKRTGLTVFRPTPGLDEGPVILQKSCDIGPDDTLGEVYFNHLFPLGVQALLEAADLVRDGRAIERVQDESQATYEGWMHDDEARIHWSQHVDAIYDLIRGCNPAPGAWTMLGGVKTRIFDARKIRVGTHGDVRGKPGEISEVTDSSIVVNAHGGRIEILRVRPEGGGKLGAGDFARQRGLAPGTFATHA